MLKAIYTDSSIISRQLIYLYIKRDQLAVVRYDFIFSWASISNIKRKFLSELFLYIGETQFDYWKWFTPIFVCSLEEQEEAFYNIVSIQLPVKKHTKFCPFIGLSMENVANNFRVISISDWLLRGSTKRKSLVFSIEQPILVNTCIYLTSKVSSY